MTFSDIREKPLKRHESATSPDQIITKTEDKYLLASLGDIDGTSWQLRLTPFQNSDKGAEEKLAELAKIDDDYGNAFFLPGLQKAAMTRILPDDLAHLIMIRKDATGQKPVFYSPVFFTRSPLKTGKILKAAETMHSPLATPLIASDEPQKTLTRFCELYAIAVKSGLPPLVFNFVNRQSRFAQGINEAANTSRIGIEQIVLGERPKLESEEAYRERHKSKRSTNARMRRRLMEKGTISHLMFKTPEAIKDALEDYLTLEAAGWKGRQGTALKMDEASCAFARQAVAGLSKTGNCEIFTMHFNGKTIASVIVLNHNGTYFPWKITFDEAFKKYSPGALLLLDLSEELLKREDFVMIDSISGVGTTWTDNLWPERLGMERIIIGASAKTAKKLRRQYDHYDWLKTKARKFLKR